MAHLSERRDFTGVRESGSKKAGGVLKKERKACTLNTFLPSTSSSQQLHRNACVPNNNYDFITFVQFTTTKQSHYILFSQTPLDKS